MPRQRQPDEPLVDYLRDVGLTSMEETIDAAMQEHQHYEREMNRWIERQLFYTPQEHIPVGGARVQFMGIPLGRGPFEFVSWDEVQPVTVTVRPTPPACLCKRHTRHEETIQGMLHAS